MHNVAIFDDVFFAFQTHKAFFSNPCFGFTLNQIIEMVSFGPYKAALKISVNYPGSLWCFKSLLNCPSANFFFARSKIGN